MTKTWGILVLGQLVSFSLACGGAAQATLHWECDFSAPTLSTTFVYLLMFLFLIPVYCRKRKLLSDSDNEKIDNDDHKMTTSPCRNGSKCITTSLSNSLPKIILNPGKPKQSSSMWSYFFVALLDVEANYITVLAYKYTTATSVNLLDALAIPSSMILSRFALKRVYRSVHVTGAVVCIVGIVINVYTDYHIENERISSGGSDDDILMKEENEYPHRLFGDILGLFAGVLWGVNNVAQEYLIQEGGDPMEFLGMLGMFGSLISIFQVVLLERGDFLSLIAQSSKGEMKVSTVNQK
eukprot:CAMPEP_0194383192 /NCGR_PEP_ID=MMETSP0174-20130528/65808_1 /TAXON_ID=216777 /ORGANISM="Proboscia alata, Strain PI-D3" /LENGTH=294 /DNA_ID=CAMNT_0039169221 /DNA_START=9 /DNA_END=894 /DNA_ORIENTATION=-